MARMKHMRSMKRGNWNFDSMPEDSRTYDVDETEEVPWDSDNGYDFGVDDDEGEEGE